MLPCRIDIVTAPACAPCEKPCGLGVAGVGVNTRRAIVAEDDEPALVKVNSHYGTIIIFLARDYGAKSLVSV
jgi:hypothetical protein